MQPCGYHHRDYAFSLSDYGKPVQLEHSEGWLLQRRIPGSTCLDAMGCYPLFTCDNWQGLFDDLRDLKDQIIAVWLITDPFADIGLDALRYFFKDSCFLFKEHIVVDLSQPIESAVSRHHQRYAKKALKQMDIHVVENAESYVDIWTKLYGNLIKRHQIKGLIRFSKKSFSQQLNVPGCIVFKAVYKGRVIAMQIWYQYHDRAYYHLGASSDEGYRQHAAFGLFWEAIIFFESKGLRYLNIGAGAGTKPNPSDGLTRFKKGWANSVRPVYFCGAVMDPKQYNELCRKDKNPADDYFPAYRAGEFL